MKHMLERDSHIKFMLRRLQNEVVPLQREASRSISLEALRKAIKTYFVKLAF